MVVGRLVAAPLPFTLATQFRLAVCKRQGSRLSTNAFLVADTPPGNRLADECCTRIAFGYLAHSPFRVNCLERELTGSRLSIQFRKIRQEICSSAFSVYHLYSFKPTKIGGAC